MSSKKYGSPLNLKIRPSSHLSGFYLLTHGGAIGVVCSVGIPIWASITLNVIIFLNFVHLMTRDALMAQKASIVEAVWDRDGHWTLLNLNGESLTAQLLPNRFVHPMLVLLNFQLNGLLQRRTLVLPSDSMDHKTFRQLRVRLQLEKDNIEKDI